MSSFRAVSDRRHSHAAGLEPLPGIQILVIESLGNSSNPARATQLNSFPVSGRPAPSRRQAGLCSHYEPDTGMVLSSTAGCILLDAV